MAKDCPMASVIRGALTSVLFGQWGCQGVGEPAAFALL